MRVGGIVLCGGQSSRMGRPKAWLPLGIDTFLGHTVRAVAEVCETVVVVAAPDQSLPPLPALPIPLTIEHDPQPHQGPLAGLVAGLDSPALAPCDALLLLSCDTPLVPPAALRLLLTSLESEPCDAALPCVDDRLHPFPSAFRAEHRHLARQTLANQRRRLLDFFEALRLQHISRERLRAVDPELRSLLNVNSPEDYERLVAYFDGGTP